MLLPFALSGGWTSSVDRRGFLLSGSGESGESLMTSDSCSSLSSKPFNLRSKAAAPQLNTDGEWSRPFWLRIPHKAKPNLSESCQLLSSVSLLLLLSVLSSRSSLFLPLFFLSSSSAGLLRHATMQSSTRWCRSVSPAWVLTSVSSSFHMVRYCSSLSQSRVRVRHYGEQCDLSN